MLSTLFITVVMVVYSIHYTLAFTLRKLSTIPKIRVNRLSYEVKPEDKVEYLKQMQVVKDQLKLFKDVLAQAGGIKSFLKKGGDYDKAFEAMLSAFRRNILDSALRYLVC
jgi:hypothetical protein